MALQLGLSFGNGPFIVHQLAPVRQRALGYQPKFLLRALCDLCAMTLPLPRSSSNPRADNEELLA